MRSSIHLLCHGLAGMALLLGTSAVVHASSITPGNIVVVRVGDGLAPPTSASTAVFLEEYTPGGALVQTLALPTSASGTNNPFANSGTATSEGYLNLSADGRYLVQAGYAAAPGLASIASTASPTAPRTVARTDLAGNIDTSTALSGDTSYSSNNIRSVTSNDGTQFWTAGTAAAAADGGVRYVASLGANTSTQITISVTNTRVVGLFGGQLYVSTASGSFKGVSAIGTGLPTTAGQTTVLLAGFPSLTPSQYDFYFADANTLYVAEDGSSGATGGIEKWTLSAGTWVRQYTLSPGAAIGCRGLTGSVTAGVATLFATTTEVTSNQLAVVTDTGAGSTFTTLTNAQTNTVFRGLRQITTPVVTVPGNSFCAGDGTGTACPCANASTVGNNEGCLNSLGLGGKIVASGNASIASDTLVLQGTQMPNSSALYFQGTSQAGSGAGTVFGDGLRCAAGSVIRLGTKSNAAGASQYPAAGDPGIATKGLVLAPGVRTYQCWYRNAAAFCTTSTFNLTNGWQTTWAP
jgi:hypothetical protein